MACTLSGTLAWISDPQDGCTHDTQALRRCGLLDVPTTDLPDETPPPRHIGDKGYTGLGMITPKRKPAKLLLHPDDKAYSTTVNQVRYKIERVITNIKTWRVLHAGYRRPLDTFPETVEIVRIPLDLQSSRADRLRHQKLGQVAPSIVHLEIGQSEAPEIHDRRIRTCPSSPDKGMGLGVRIGGGVVTEALSQ